MIRDSRIGRISEIHKFFSEAVIEVISLGELAGDLSEVSLTIAKERFLKIIPCDLNTDGNEVEDSVVTEDLGKIFLAIRKKTEGTRTIFYSLYEGERGKPWECKDSYKAAVSTVASIRSVISGKVVFVKDVERLIAAIKDGKIALSGKKT